MKLRQTLYTWRDNEAVKRGVEFFRILPNNTLDEIVRSLPRTKDELIAIKGIKDAKYREFGKIILAMVDEHMTATKVAPKDRGIQGDTFPSQEVTLDTRETAYSVSTYLNIVNRELYRLHARVKGEVTSAKLQGSALYLGLKDADDESALSVFMWARDYALSGLELVEGMEVVVEGRSEIYKPSGRFNFRAETIELVGEGALKKAYDALKKKLDGEGLFAPEKKRPLTEYPEHVGLITSKQGAVIHDFLNNLGKFGFKVRFMDSRVEGAVAVKDILAAVVYFSTQPIDTLVIIRGGGSLESLQAFNNERVVRAI
ncbi:MAG: exodeoxyribonuclease VII large subunit, partial [Patescibacteria group bacterium]